MSDTLEGQVQVYYVDADESPEITDRFKVMGLPTMILFKDGKPFDKLVGYHPEPEVRGFLGQLH